MPNLLRLIVGEMEGDVEAAEPHREHAYHHYTHHTGMIYPSSAWPLAQVALMSDIVSVLSQADRTRHHQV